MLVRTSIQTLFTFFTKDLQELNANTHEYVICNTRYSFCVFIHPMVELVVARRQWMREDVTIKAIKAIDDINRTVDMIGVFSMIPEVCAYDWLLVL